MFGVAGFTLASLFCGVAGNFELTILAAVVGLSFMLPRYIRPAHPDDAVL